VILGFVTERLKTISDLVLGASTPRRLDLTVKTPDRAFTEEERSKIPTVFTVLRAVTDLFYSQADASLGSTAPSATILPSSSMRST
jgi:anthranilate synthase